MTVRCETDVRETEHVLLEPAFTEAHSSSPRIVRWEMLSGSSWTRTTSVLITTEMPRLTQQSTERVMSSILHVLSVLKAPWRSAVQRRTSAAAWSLGAMDCINAEFAEFESEIVAVLWKQKTAIWITARSDRARTSKCVRLTRRQRLDLRIGLFENQWTGSHRV